MSLSPCQVLYLEDSDLDAELVLTRLAKSELPVQVHRVIVRADYEEQLLSHRFDIVLSDYQVPGFTGVEALELARQYLPEAPFIFVSGAMGEELAIETIKQGATDYVLKQRLARLPVAIERAMADVRERRARRDSEHAYLDAQEKLRFAQEAAGMGVWELNLETGDIICSPLCKQNLGLRRETHVSRASLMELIHVDDRERVSESIQAAIQKQADYNVDYRVAWPDGEIHWLNVRGRFVAEAQGLPARMSGVSLDITERKRSEENLKASEARFRAIVEMSPECVKLVAADGTVLQMNPAGLKMIEAESDAAIVGHSVYGVIAPEFLSLYREFNERVCRGEAGTIEYDIVGLRGTRRHMETSAVPLKEPHGRVMQMAVSRDITARKRAVDALKQSEAQFRQLAETLPNMAWMANPDGNIFWYNSRWYDYTGTSPEDVAGWGWQDLHDPEMLPEVIERWRISLETGRPFEMVFPLRAKDGAYHPFLTLAHPFRGSDNEILYWFGTNTDISAQKETEESLARQANVERHRADLLSQLAGASRTVNAVLSVDSIITVLANEARRILGAHLAVITTNGRGDATRAQTAISMSDKYRDLPDIDREKRINLLTEADRGISVPLISHLGTQFGTIHVEDKIEGEFAVEDQIALRQLANIATVGIENARLYESLREQDKRKDEFLATLAHELRNPLAPLRNALSILRLDPSARGGSLVDMMERQLSHMVRLIDDLLDISRISRNKMELRLARIQLTDVINSAIETSRPLIEEAGHQLTISLPSEAIVVNGDLTRLAQVFSNLLSNSAKYTQAGQICLKAVRRDDEVMVSITDNGIGIPPDAIGHVFDMFWQVDRSIERQTGGLGIGLALVKGIVEMHQGSISAQSAGHGQGSTFTVRLPILAPAVDGRPLNAASHPQMSNRPTSPRRRILVVDDNVDSAKSMSLMLGVLGNEVATAYDGLQALEEVTRFHPDVILMDVGMPHLNGYEAARRIRESSDRSTLKIVALTGWGQETDRQRSFEAGCDAHLVKPVSLDDLNKVLSSFVTNDTPSRSGAV